MKHLKWLSLLLTFFLLCVFSCGCGSTAKKDLLEALRSARVITASDSDLFFTLEWSETNGIVRIVFRFSSPEQLKPLTITEENGKIHASYKGLETEVTEEFCARLLPLSRAMRAFRSSGTETGVQGDRSYLRAALDGDTFLMYYDPASGVFTRLEWTGESGSGGYDILSCTASDSE
ncbi:MAG: hypothetical protein J1E00_04195 [Oscillospiraceae bacterium]|nr:hypothetical protein [Oscillospiraceae bacterium]